MSQATVYQESNGNYFSLFRTHLFVPVGQVVKDTLASHPEEF
jgi:hypothetical protein